MKKHFFVNYILVFAFVLFIFISVPAQNTVQIEEKATGGIATLYSFDPLAHSLCFGDGQAGGVFQQNETRNRCSDIDFNNYYENSFTVGIEGSRSGVILDLGNASDLQKRYGFSETVGKGQGFASLRVENNHVFILKDRQTHSEQSLTESALLFADNKNSSASAKIQLGHMYLLRIVDRNDKKFERLVKLIVIAYKLNESVTIRWQLL